jgi:salicylate hydroxylase
VSQRLQQFAQARWQRNARVQARAVRNGQIFHATGPMRVGRDMGLRLMGSKLMDVPWLYGYQRS